MPIVSVLNSFIQAVINPAVSGVRFFAGENTALIRDHDMKAASMKSRHMSLGIVHYYETSPGF